MTKPDPILQQIFDLAKLPAIVYQSKRGQRKGKK